MIIYSLKHYWTSTGYNSFPFIYLGISIFGIATGLYLFYLLVSKELRKEFGISKSFMIKYFLVSFVLVGLYAAVAYLFGF